MKKRHNEFSLAGAFAVLLLLFLFTACEQNLAPSPMRLGWDYYPLAQGQYRLYDVYRINYNFAEENDTLSYELKELVSEYYLNQQNDTVYVLRRYQRTSPEDAWAVDSAYLVQRTSRWVIQTVNNRPQLQLAFPVIDGLTWNANMLNASVADSFTIEQLGKPYTLGDQLWNNTLTVEQENLPDQIVETDLRHEVYAAGVGMVYKYTKNLKYCTKDCEGTSVITTGLFLEMKLKETGTEP